VRPVEGVDGNAGVEHSFDRLGVSRVRRGV
jgi:hypothetical protein